MDPEKSKPVNQRVFLETSPRWLRFFSQVKRARMYVDKNVQGGILTRVAIHWGLFFFTTAFAYIVIQAIVAPTGSTFVSRLQGALTEFTILGFLMLSLLPAFMLDFVRFSNRFAGPIVRLRRFLRELGENGDVPPLKFRDDDFWVDVAKEFNVCRERLMRQKLEIERLQNLLAANDIDASEWKPESSGMTASV